MAEESGGRRASAADSDLVTTIVTLAFAGDPLWSRALARPDGSTDHHSLFWRVLVEAALRNGWTWVSSGGEATAVWIPPGGSELAPAEEAQMAALADEQLGPAAAAAHRELLDRLDEAHPRTEPHYYLSLLATHPDHRGKGIGMRLLAHNLELIDAEGVPAFLEPSNPANDERYRGVGFEPIGRFSYRGGGPAVTTMWRAAR